jgi:hypothetical protein
MARVVLKVDGGRCTPKWTANLRLKWTVGSTGGLKTKPDTETDKTDAQTDKTDSLGAKKSRVVQNQT